jgi:hypothetical protein
MVAVAVYSGLSIRRPEQWWAEQTVHGLIAWTAVKSRVHNGTTIITFWIVDLQEQPEAGENQYITPKGARNKDAPKE